MRKEYLTPPVLIILAIITLGIAFVIYFHTNLVRQTKTPSTQTNQSPSDIVINTPNERVTQSVDCSYAETLQFKEFLLGDQIKITAGYVNVEGLIVSRQEFVDYNLDGIDDNITGVFISITPQVGQNELFYSDFLNGKRGDAARTEGEVLLFRLGERTKSGSLSTTAKTSSATKKTLENIIDTQKIIRLKLVLEGSLGGHIPTNFSAACKIELN